MSSPAYAQLYTLSNFSFLRGASHPEELVEQAHRLGYTAMALTDECSLAGVVRAHQRAQSLGMQLIHGSEIQLEDGGCLVLLAPSLAAWQQISSLITRGRRRAEKGAYSLTQADVLELAPQALCLLVPQTLGLKPAQPDQDQPAQHADEDLAAWLAIHYPGQAWVAVEQLCDGADEARLRQAQALAWRHGLPAVAATGVLMHRRSRKALQDCLSATRLNKPLRQCGRALQANAERSLRQRARLARLYPPELLEESLRIARRCDFSLDSLRYQYPAELVPAGQTASAYLRQLTEEGLAQRFSGAVPAPIRQRVEQELSLIEELGYEPYFLTVHDLVRFARSQGILCQGRGSAANSAVCFYLGITCVNPATSELLFERFISRERNEPPDIDVDFEHARREEVFQYIYRKYGRDRAALAATVICYRKRSALRDLGRALGLSRDQLDRLSGALAWWDQPESLLARLQELGFDPSSAVLQKLFELLPQLIGFPRHLSQHVGGFVLSDAPLSQLVPIENAAMAERTIIQWDKDDLDALGLLKVDCLALGMLTAIHKAFDLVRGAHQRDLDLAQVLADQDPKVYAMLQRGESTGVFQVESRAQMTMLPRLKPRAFYDLVIEVAIVRPGPIQGGMVHPYLRRRRGEEAVDCPPGLERILGRTLGVPIFQEQVMAICMAAAGFTAGEADQVRRSMAAWRRKGGLEVFEQRLKQGMTANGYAPEFAQRIFQQVQGFGEYGFPESHAASFAALVYVSAWLKCHYPAAFYAALLNSQPMGFYSPSQLVQDARRMGVEVRPVDVNASGAQSQLEVDASPAGQAPSPPALRLGLNQIQQLGAEAAQRVAAQRPYRSVAELVQKAALQTRDRQALARAGALRSLAGHRHQAHWQMAAVDHEPSLPAVAEEAAALPAPTAGEDCLADYASLGLTLGQHPMQLLRPHLPRRLLTMAQWENLAHKRRCQVAGLVTNRQRPGTASGVVFLTLEDETGVSNLVVWPRVLEKYRAEVLQGRLLLASGHMERDGRVRHLIVDRLQAQDHLLGRLRTVSRDFH